MEIRFYKYEYPNSVPSDPDGRYIAVDGYGVFHMAQWDVNWGFVTWSGNPLRAPIAWAYAPTATEVMESIAGERE